MICKLLKAYNLLDFMSLRVNSKPLLTESIIHGDELYNNMEVHLHVRDLLNRHIGKVPV